MLETLTEHQDVLAALRAATAERHAILDAQTPLAQADVDLAAYRAHLQLLEQWLAPIAAWLGGSMPGEGNSPRGAVDDGGDIRTHAPVLTDYLATIRADLAHPSLDGQAAAAGKACADDEKRSAAQPWPAQASAAYRWGVCYVVEGSQLGGAVLYKRLAERLAPHPLAYLRGNGSPGPRWQQFMAALRAHVTSPAQVAEACQGACDAFDRLIALNRLRAHAQ